jgi:uncharacterized protein
MDIGGFEWDRGNREKCQKHGVSIEAIEALFDGNVDLYEDKQHSLDEPRKYAIGPNITGRWILVVFTFRRTETQLLIRPISARFMHKKEIEIYEKETSSSQER